jgi:rhamnosyltransferase subunit B
VKIVVTTIGSLGDLHPFVALALELKARGHHPILATCELYRRKIEALGIEFRPIRPDVAAFRDPETLNRLMDPRHGSARVVLHFMIPALAETYEDLTSASDGADLIITSPFTFATSLVAEKKQIPWVSTALCPVTIPSAYDPPIIPGSAILSVFRPLAPLYYGLAFKYVRSVTAPWGEPWHRLRQQIGLPVIERNPLVDGYSPHLVLALFSKLLMEKQKDWPPHTVRTGFPFFDQSGDEPLQFSERLEKFLQEGEPPIVFTLGSAASWVAGDFYQICLEAAQILKKRAVLLVGSKPDNQIGSLPDNVIVESYAPFSNLFARSAVNVHHGGVGTTGQAMRAGRPMLVVPFAHDQPDNAYRVVRLGIARTITKQKLSAVRMAKELDKLLSEASYRAKSEEVANQVRQEDGVTVACNAIEALVRLDVGSRLLCPPTKAMAEKSKSSS